MSYAYNAFLGGTASLFGSDLPGTIKAAQTVMLTDGVSTPQMGVAPDKWKQKIATSAATGKPDTLNRTGYLLVHAGTSPAITLPEYGAPLARHQGRTDVLWADGHAKSVRIETFYHVPGQPEDPNKPVGASQWWSPCLEPTFGCPE